MEKKPKTIKEINKAFTEARKKNEWQVVPIAQLPDGVPVLGVSQLPNKSFAEFQLVEMVLMPLSLTPKTPSNDK